MTIARALLFTTFVHLMLATPFRVQAQSVFVPLNHWAYEYLERLEAGGLISGVLNSARPMSRHDLVGLLVKVDRQELNKVEADQFDYLFFEFQEEFLEQTGKNGNHYRSDIQRLKETTFPGRLFPDFLYRNNRNLYSVNTSDFKLNADPVLVQEWNYADPDSLSSGDRVFRRSHGFSLWGNFASKIGFYFNFRDTKEWGTRTYPSRYDISLPGRGFVNGYGTHIWHDETVSYLVFGVPYVQIMIGKDSNYWGPGFNGALAVSDNATSYDQLKLISKIWRLRFTYFWGFLRTFPVIRDPAGSTVEKSIVAHKLEIDVAEWLDVGLYETVVFGSRRFELAYLNPINFYRSAEHFLSDNDNATMGMDFELFLIPGVKLYGELFIDDLFTSKLGTGWWGNKVAYLAGGFWPNTFGISNLDARAEYAKIRPYVYSHINAINTYSHFSTALGHWIGPNSDDLYLRLQYRLSRRASLAVDFESFRHGANTVGTNVGGDINRTLEPGDSGTVDFLDGEKERKERFGVELNYELLRSLFFTINFNWEDSDNLVLPGGARGPLSRNEFLFGFRLNE
jgi:hypothetical protein